MDDIKIQVLENKLTEWELMLEPWCEFFKDDVLGSAIPGFQEPKYKPNLRELLRHNVNYDEESPCIMAWDTRNNHAAGLLIANTLYKTPPPELAGKPLMDWFSLEWDQNTLDGIRIVDEFLNKMVEKSDIFTKYNVEKAMLINITSVGEDYRRKGLAHQMTEILLEEAKRRGFPLVVSESTSAFTQKSKIEKFGFEPVKEFSHKECFPSYSSIPQELRSVHDKTVVLAKRL